MRRNVRWPTRGIGLAPVLALLLPCAAAAQTGGARVDSLLRAMTLEEKVTFLRGERDPAGLGQAGYVPGVPRRAYDLIIQASSGARGRVTLDGERAAMRTRLIPTSYGRANTSLTLNLEAGVRHALEIDAEDGRAVREGEEGLEIRLAWVTPERWRAVLDGAVTAARDARTAVVFAYNEGTEGVDRASLSLPGGQDDLVEAIARVNPRTVVVLQTGTRCSCPGSTTSAPSCRRGTRGRRGETPPRRCWSAKTRLRASCP